MSEEERELDELLGAYALDAVSDDERRAVENYMLVSPRARAEVQEHREVASMLAWSGTDAPEGLWDRIAGTLAEQAPRPTGELAKVLSIGGGRERRRRSWSTSLGAWAAAAAAAAVIAVVAVSAIDDGRGDGGLSGAAAEARADRDSRVITVMSPDGAAGVEAIIDQDGHGYLLAGEMPALPDGRTWQLWGVINGQAISLGVLGNDPELEMFSVDSTEIYQLVVTDEVAGGVISGANPDGAWIGTFN